MPRVVLTGVIAVVLLAVGCGGPVLASPFASGIAMEESLVVADTQRLEIDLPGRPVHVAVRRSQAVEIIAVLRDGRRVTVAARPGGAHITGVESGPTPAPTHIPALPDSWYAENYLTAPARLDDDSILAVTTNGELLWAPEPNSGGVRPEFQALELSQPLLPDTRIVPLDPGRWIALAAPTDEYPHGIMGDRLEARGFVVIDAGEAGQPPRVSYVELETDGVMETVLPVVGDLVGDGAPEILVPVSTRFGGSRLVAAAPDGSVVAEGPPIGLGNRWRHVLAVAPSGPNGETEVLVVRTPHIGGVLEFYQLQGNRLSVVHGRGGVSTHRIGDRTLQTAVVGDFIGNGGVQVMLPTQNQEELLVVNHTRDGSEVHARIALPSRLSTNIATDRGVVALGTRNGTLVILLNG